jgi:hypothetical protein
MSGLGNPIPFDTGPGVAISGNYSGGAYQQVNVGDIMCQYVDATWGNIAIPVAAVPAGATAASNSAASKNTLQQIHGANLESNQGSNGSVYGFLGVSMSYRDPNNPAAPPIAGSAGRIGIAPRGRCKMRIVSTDVNFNSALPAGVLIGAAVNGMSTATGSFLATPLPGLVQTTQACASQTNVNGTTYAGTTAAGTSTPLTASEAIGRLAFAKAAGDLFVWVDIISTVLEGGVQNTNTST